VNVLAYEYTGYGASTGTPTEANTYADIDAAYELACKYVKDPAKEIILYGQSGKHSKGERGRDCMSLCVLVCFVPVRCVRCMLYVHFVLCVLCVRFVLSVLYAV
jgi:hypothetical protein